MRKCNCELTKFESTVPSEYLTYIGINYLIYKI